jgi:hypothetical protein
MDRSDALKSFAAMVAAGALSPPVTAPQQRQSRTPPMADVREFGASANGVADDTAAIQAAHDAGQGILFFPPGTYRITRTLNLTRTTILQGSGASMNFRPFLPYRPVSTLLWDGPPGGTMLAITRVNGGGIRDIALDGNGRAATAIRAQGIQQAGWQNLSIDRTTAGAATDAAIVLHGGAHPDQNNVMFCSFSNIALTNVAKGWMLTSAHPDTDVCLNVFSGLWVSFLGEYAMRIEAADNNDFINFYQNRISGDGAALYLAEPGPNDLPFGARYNCFYHPQGNNAPVVADPPFVNLAFAYDHSNGMPNPTGKHPENFSQIGTSSADINIKGPVNVGAGSSYEVRGVPVVSGRKGGWSRPTGAASRATFDTKKVTVSQLAERLKALIDDLSDHGLIGS